VSVPRERPDVAATMVDHLFRTRAGQMVAFLTRHFGPAYLELAEEVVQDALVKALQQWPYSGIPSNPGGWLFKVARNGALDVLRRDTSFAGRADALANELALAHRSDEDADRFDHSAGDDELRMIFMCCHPSLPRDARVALSLKTVGGFSVEEIGRAFLVPASTVAQRLVRAKRQIRDCRLSLDLPAPKEFSARLDSVLEVVYLLFNEGYTAHRGEELIRLDLCREALRLGRLIAGSAATAAPAADALVALMAFHAARLAARVDESDELVLLDDQDRSKWDRRLIALGFHHLERCSEGPTETAYHLQAVIAAAHATSEDATATPWPHILELYDRLMLVAPTPVVMLNRAVALSRVQGPEAALRAVQMVEREPSLTTYYLLPSVKGWLLEELGLHQDAVEAYRQALQQTCSEPERRFLARRIERLTSG
jgi:RNA polymerase sigma-70 factor, ECF subfamily